MTDLVAMGEMQVTVDCDVLQADGGTRTASICGAYVALHDCFTRLVPDAAAVVPPAHRRLRGGVGGVVDGACLLDLDYSEDSRAEVDMNVVMTGSGRFVEVQGTAEGMAFTRGELDELLSLAEHGIASCSTPSGRAGRASRPSVTDRATATATASGDRGRSLRWCWPPPTPTRRRDRGHRDRDGR